MKVTQHMGRLLILVVFLASLALDATESSFGAVDAFQVAFVARRDPSFVQQGQGTRGVNIIRQWQSIGCCKCTLFMTKSDQRAVKNAQEKKPTKRVPSVEDPPHWTNASDHFSITLLTQQGPITLDSHAALQEYCAHHDTNHEKSRVGSLAMTIRGHPLPLRRHRTSRGFMYNPSAKAQASFRNETSMLVFGMGDENVFESTTDCNVTSGPPLFTAEASLSVTLILRLRRPLSHFRAGRRETCTLKAGAPASLTSVTRTDVDNLAKFVLDACNGLLYEDDRQIQNLHVIKQLDNEGECLGSTQLFIRAIDDSMENEILLHAVQPYKG